LSYQMYAALKYDRPRAKLTYSEFCAHAPQMRHVDWERVRSQMNKVHRPHRQSGYIAKVDFQQTTDSAGGPDWIMLYMPGPKAKAEYKAFTKRGGPTVLEIEPLDAKSQSVAPETTELERELIQRGVSPAAAAELVREHAEEKIQAQMERLDWQIEKNPGKITEPAAYLVQAIKNDYAAPKGFVSQAERQRRQEARQAKARQEAEEHRLQREHDARERAEREEIDTYIEQLDPAERAKLQAEALSQASMESKRSYEDPALSQFRETFMLGMLREHVRQLLGLRKLVPAAA